MAYLGEEIKKLGFGLMRLPRLEGEGDVIDVEQTKKMVDLFLEAGFTYFDTAWAVGHLKEELDSLKRTLVEKERQLVHVWAQSVSEEEKTVCMFSEDISADAMRQYVNEVLEKVLRNPVCSERKKRDQRKKIPGEAASG